MLEEFIMRNSQGNYPGNRQGNLGTPNNAPMNTQGLSGDPKLIGNAAKKNIGRQEAVAKNKRKYTIAAAVLICIIIAALLAFVLLNLPSKGVKLFKEQIREENYNGAYSTYEKLNAEDKTKANTWMRQYIDSVEEDYHAGRLDAYTATGILRELERFDAVAQYANTAMSKFSSDEQAENAWKRAEAHAHNENWLEAYRELQLVNSQHSRYNDAVALKQECITHIESDTLSVASDYAQQGKYEEAIRHIEQVQDAYNCSAFDAAVAQYTEDLKQETAWKNAEAYAKQGNWLDAFKELQKVDSQHKRYGEATSLKDKCTANIRVETLETADSYAQKGKYEEAIHYIQQVQTVYNCSAFDQAIAKYKSFLPTKITVLPTKSYPDDIYLYRGDVTDVFGVEHKDVYYSGDTNASFVFCPNGNYTLLTCRIYTVAGMDRKGDDDIHIHVYLDGHFAYESDLVSCENDNFVFYLDITGVDDIRFKVDDAVIIEATVS